MKRLVAQLSLSLICVACSGVKIENPSGDCKSEGDGSRACYSSTEKDSSYLKDCENPLDRDYWRIFAFSEDDAGMLPRPDALGIALGICDGEDAELAEVFERSGLCEPVGDPEVINHLLLDDAFVISKTLHENLYFEAQEQGGSVWGVVPFAPYDEVDFACENSSVDLEGAARVCEFAHEKVSSKQCDDIGLVYREQEAKLIAEALNDTYGIDVR